MPKTEIDIWGECITLTTTYEDGQCRTFAFDPPVDLEELIEKNVEFENA